MHIGRKRFFILLIFFIGILLVGCGSSSIEPTNTATDDPQTATFTATELSPTNTHTSEPPTNTPTTQPTSTETPAPTDTATQTATDTETPTATPPQVAIGAGVNSVPDGVLIYFIHRGTGGPICGTDSAIGIRGRVKQSNDVAKDVKAGLNDLFSYKSEWVGGLYNPLYLSNLRVQSVKFKDGLLTVNMTGTYKPTGDDCDNLRVKAQVWSTARQYRSVKNTNIYLNGIPFGDRVSNDK